MLDALIDFLRTNSTSFSHPVNALSQELSRMESYLTLMQLRLGVRLRYEVACSPSVAASEVPTACVLVLAENAIHPTGASRSAATRTGAHSPSMSTMTGRAWQRQGL